MTTGTVMVFVAPDGRVIADAADFDQSRPGGFTTAEAQRHRCTIRLCLAVFDAFCSPTLVDATDDYIRSGVLAKLEAKGYIKHTISVEVPERTE